MVYQTLKAGLSCNELAKKVKDYLDSRGQPDDLHEEADLTGDHANEADWERIYMYDAQVHDEVRPDL